MLGAVDLLDVSMRRWLGEAGLGVRNRGGRSGQTVGGCSGKSKSLDMDYYEG